MSVPILDQQSTVIGVIQISRKGSDPRFTQDFSREDLHDLEVAAGVLAASPVMLAIKLARCALDPHRGFAESRSRIKFSEFVPENCWCERGDSNPHGFTRQILSLVRLPIPPLSHHAQLYKAAGILFQHLCGNDCDAEQRHRRAVNGAEWMRSGLELKTALPAPFVR